MDSYLDTMFDDAPIERSRPSVIEAEVSLDVSAVIRDILTEIEAFTNVTFGSMRKLSRACTQACKQHLLMTVESAPVNPRAMNARTRSDLEFICDLLSIPASASVRGRISQL